MTFIEIEDLVKQLGNQVDQATLSQLVQMETRSWEGAKQRKIEFEPVFEPLAVAQHIPSAMHQSVDRGSRLDLGYDRLPLSISASGDGLVSCILLKLLFSYF